MKTKFMVVLVLTASLLAACGSDKANHPQGGKLIAATQLDSKSPYAAGFRKFKEVVESETEAKIAVEIYTDGALGGNEDELVQNLETGLVDVVVAAPGFMAQSVQEVDFFAMPYLFESYRHWEKVVDGEVGAAVTQAIEQKTNFKILGYWSAGVRNYYGFKPIQTPADLKNISVRVQNSPVVKNTWGSLGAQPTSVAWGEMYQALQNKVIDAAENDFTNIFQASHHEAAKFISLTEHDFTTRLFFVSEKKFNELSEKQQQLIIKAAKEATKAAREADQQLAVDSKQKLIDAGVQINEVDKTPFIDLTEQVRQSAVEQLNMNDLYTKVVELR